VDEASVAVRGHVRGRRQAEMSGQKRNGARDVGDHHPVLRGLNDGKTGQSRQGRRWLAGSTTKAQVPCRERPEDGVALSAETKIDDRPDRAGMLSRPKKSGSRGLPLMSVRRHCEDCWFYDREKFKGSSLDEGAPRCGKQIQWHRVYLKSQYTGFRADDKG